MADTLGLLIRRICVTNYYQNESVLRSVVDWMHGLMPMLEKSTRLLNMLVSDNDLVKGPTIAPEQA